MANYFLILLKLLPLVAALPALNTTHAVRRGAPAIPAITEAMLVSIAPTSASCTGTFKLDQCMTAKRMAALDLVGIAKSWGLTTKGEIAAGLASMAIDSNEFKFDDNISETMVQQGTYGMMVAPYIMSYAQALGAKDSKFNAKLQGLISGNFDDPNYIKDLKAVNSLLTADDGKNVGATFWRISQINVQPIRDGLKAGTGWSDFNTKAGGSGRFLQGVTPKTQGYWDRACKALGGC